MEQRSRRAARPQSRWAGCRASAEAHDKRWRRRSNQLTLPVPALRAPEHAHAPPADGLYVHGMLIEGARFDAASGLLAEAEAGELMSPMPLLHLRVLPKEEVDQAKAAQQTYDCPYYVTNERQGQLATTGHSNNFVMMVNLPTDVEPSHWVLRGVALVAQTNG